MYRAAWFSEFPVHAAYKIQLLLCAECNGASPIAIAGFCQKLFLQRQLNANVLVSIGRASMSEAGWRVSSFEWASMSEAGWWVSSFEWVSMSEAGWWVSEK